MRPSTQVALSFGGLLIAAAAIGYAAGQRHTSLDESALIDRAADLYVDETGNARTACVGRPGRGEIWLIVTCGTGQTARIYRFDRSGRQSGLPADQDT